MRTTSTFAALAAATALVLGAAPAGAAPAPSPAPAPPAATQPIPTLDDAVGLQLSSLVDALKRDLGLTPEQFLAQADLGQRLAEASPQWAQEFRDSFGGVWLDESGTGLVGIAPGDAATELRAQATDAGFTVQDVALTADELTARERQVGKIVDSLPAETKALVTGVRVDPTQNEVVVSTRGGDAAQLGNLTARLKDLAVVDMTEAPDPRNDLAPFGSEGGTQSEDGGPTMEGLEPATTRAGTPNAAPKSPGAAAPAPGGDSGSLGSLALLNDAGVIPEGPMRTVVDLLSSMTTGTGSIIDGMNESVPNPVTPVPAEQRRTDRVAPSGPVIGGTAYEVGVPGGILECSTGFNGELDGKPVVITAAHCAGGNDNPVAFPGGEKFGTMTGVAKDRIDTALIAVDDAHADRFRTNLVGTGADTTQAITGTADPVVGQKACKSGSTTGFSCGTISDVAGTIDVAGTRTIANAFTVDLCALPGDSGGVVFSGDKALGVSSASNVADAGNCANADALAKTNGFIPRLSAVPITDVLASHPGLTLRTS